MKENNALLRLEVWGLRPTTQLFYTISLFSSDPENLS